MLYPVYVYDLVRPTGVLDDDSGSDLVILGNNGLLAELIVCVFLKGDVGVSPSELTTLHLGNHFIDLFVLFFHNHVLVSAKIMHNFKLLIQGGVGNMRGKAVYVLLIFKHQQFQLVCAHTSVFNCMLIVIG